MKSFRDKQSEMDSSILEESIMHPELYQNFEKRDDDLGDLITIPPESADHPMSWSLRKKIMHTFVFGIAPMSVQLSCTALSPALVQLTEEFPIGREIGTLVYSIYLLGNSLGPLLFAPMGELYGRKTGIYIPTFICGVFIILTANVTSIWAVLVLRFVSGVFAGASLVNAGGAMADMWSPKERVAALVLYAFNIVFGSAIAPLVGSALITTGGYGWRWICWTTGLFTIVNAVISLVVLSESYIPVLEQMKARNIRLDSEKWAIHSKNDEYRLTVREIIQVHLARPLMLFGTPVVLFINIYSSFVYGVLFLLIANVEELFHTIYHFAAVPASLPILAMIVGFIVGGVINILNAARYGRIAGTIKAHPPPEEFLGAMLVSGWLLPAGFFIYGWTMYSHVHWIGPIIGIGVLSAGFSVIFQGCLVYLINSYPHYAASTLASNTLLRSIFAGVFPLFAHQMYSGLNPHWASSVLGFVSLALFPIPWLFYKYGPQLRKLQPFKQVL